MGGDLIVNVIIHNGNPSKRTSLTLNVQFEDDDILWKQYDKDLVDSMHFQT